MDKNSRFKWREVSRAQRWAILAFALAITAIIRPAPGHADVCSNYSPNAVYEQYWGFNRALAGRMMCSVPNVSEARCRQNGGDYKPDNGSGQIICFMPPLSNSQATTGAPPARSRTNNDDDFDKPSPQNAAEKAKSECQSHPSVSACSDASRMLRDAGDILGATFTLMMADDIRASDAYRAKDFGAALRFYDQEIAAGQEYLSGPRGGDQFAGTVRTWISNAREREANARRSAQAAARPAPPPAASKPPSSKAAVDQCNDLFAQYTASMNAPVPLEFRRFTANRMLVIFDRVDEPTKACADADVYRRIRRETNDIELAMLRQCRGIKQVTDDKGNVLTPETFEARIQDEEASIAKIATKICATAQTQLQSVSQPVTPTVNTPRVNVPSVSTPTAPTVNTPQVNVPSVSSPNTPAVNAPQVNASPSMPTVNTPQVNAPSPPRTPR